MKNPLRRIAQFFVLLVVIGTQSPAQFVVPYPQWAKSPIDGGLPQIAIPHTPPEYSNSWPSLVGLFLPTRLRLQRLPSSVRLESSPTSGIIAMRDARGSSTAKIGINTGLDRIYSITKSNHLSTSLPLDIVVCGWSNATQASKIVKLSIPQTTDPTVVTFGPMSAPGEIWTAASLTSNKLYVFDLQSHNLKRYVDQDQDSIPETIDASFTVSMTPPTDKVINLFYPFYQVHETDPATIHFLSRTKRRLNGYMVIGNNGPEMLASPPPMGGPSVRPMEPIYAGQSRVLVAGTPGLTFQMTGGPSSPGQVISKTNTIPQSGRIIIDLSTPLQANWLIKPLLVNGSSGSSFANRVSPRSASAIFSPEDETIGEKTKIHLDADGVKTSHVAEYSLSLGGPSAPLSTVFKSNSSIYIHTPVLGDPSNNTSPYSDSKILYIWLKDTQTGKIDSNIAKIAVSLN